MIKLTDINSHAKNEYENECRILSNALFGTDYPLENPDWGSIYNNLLGNTVETLPAKLVLSLPGIDPDTAETWKRTSMKRVDSFYRNLQATAELKKILDKENISFAVIKGAACARYYPEPCFRVSGDVDFIVHQDDYNRAYITLLKNGFIDNKSEFARHENLTYKGVEFEMHRYFAMKGKDDENAGCAAELDEIVLAGLDRLQTASIDGYEFPVLPEICNGLIQLQHIRHHMKSSLGLRQVIDWMMFCDKVLDDKMWDEVFRNVAEVCELRRLAETLTKTCRMYLGFSSEKVTWCDNADEGLCKRLFRYIMKSGNMGRNRSDPVGKAFRLKNGPLSVFKNLHRKGLKEWEAAKKYKFLRPFAGLYKLIKIFVHAVQKGVTPGKVAEAARDKNEGESLTEDLGISGTYWGE